MFGIMTANGHRVLCYVSREDRRYMLKRWDQHAIPVMKRSGLEIDQLLQDYTAASSYYDLLVFEFTREQEESLLIRRLKGY